MVSDTSAPSSVLPLPVAPADPPLRVKGLGLVAAVIALCMALASALASYLWVRAADARTQERLVAQQTLEANMWVRMLTARMEAHQRLLASIADGMHSSLLDKPAVLDALMQQDGSMLRLFESLHVALPSGAVSHHGALGAVAEVDFAGVASLRRTMVEGKPSVTFLHVLDDIAHLSVLLSVPMRQSDGRLAGALAAKVKLPIAALMPEITDAQDKLQYVLLNTDGKVLAQMPDGQTALNTQALLAKYASQWQSLSQPSTAYADTQQWGDVLVTRVGMPLPQWQALIVRDTSADSLLARSLSWPAWQAWLAGVLLLALVAAGGLWRWLTPANSRLPDDGAGPVPPIPSASGAADAMTSAQAMWEYVPCALLLEQAGAIVGMTAQARVLLGYFKEEGQVLALSTLWPDTTAHAQASQALLNWRRFDGMVTLRKKDGGALCVQATAQALAEHPAITVWRLQLPWQPLASMPLPEGEHVWRDALTHLPNRDAFLWDLQSWGSDSLQAEKDAGQKYARMPTQGCLLFIDLDHLGLINEVASREMGNTLLRHVACLMADYTQPLGTLAHLGGDEFAVLLPGVSLAHAQAVAQALCDVVWQWQPHWSAERQWVSVSIGVVAMDAQRHNPQQALRAADMACYEAKRRGRCQVAVGKISAQPALPTPD